MKPRKKCITKAIITSCKNKEKLYKIWKKDPNNTVKKENYKNYIKILNRIINQAQDDHERKQIQTTMNNQKNLWRIINNKLGKNSKRNNNINFIVDNNNKKITDSKEIADHINNFFCNVGKQLRDKIKIPPNKRIRLPSWNNKSIFLHPTNHQEIQKTILNMENKNGGSDGINTLTLKVIISHISDPLVHIINLCYRPISLISNVAKVFEKLLHSRLSSFVEKCNLISNKQFGFRKNRDTKDALYQISNIIYKQLDVSDPIAITFLDLAKAFDTVDHQILLDKLYNYGIRGSAYNLIKRYLSNTKQRVKIGNDFSQYKTVYIGVPQGTILGPLLFIIYINDILTSMPEDTILSYADDTAIIIIGKSWQEVENKMNDYLQQIANWLALNKLSLDTDNTIYMEFGNNYKSTPKNMNISIQGGNIKRVENTKYLGVTFDSNMKWDSHIKKSHHQVSASFSLSNACCCS